jgi:hypothetical protein
VGWGQLNNFSTVTQLFCAHKLTSLACCLPFNKLCLLICAACHLPINKLCLIIHVAPSLAWSVMHGQQFCSVGCCRHELMQHILRLRLKHEMADLKNLEQRGKEYCLTHMLCNVSLCK